MTDSNDYDDHGTLRSWQPPAPVVAQTAPEVRDKPACASPVVGKPTPGPWFVRTRIVNGEIVGCFVSAPATNGLPYGAEIMGDDEYNEEPGGMARRLADCHAISATHELQAALRDALPGLRREFVELAQKYAGTAFENDPAYREIEARYRNAQAALAKSEGKAAS